MNQDPQSKTNSLLIPFSIVIAGICIGAGLYFGNANTLAPSQGLPSAIETTEERVERLANNAGVKTVDLAACLESGRTKAKVQEDMVDANNTGGRGTPWSIVIGPTGITYPLNGAQPVSAIAQLLDVARAESAASEVSPEQGANTDAVSPVTETDWTKGDINAPIKIVEFSDFDCPFCGRFHESMDQIVKENPDVVWAYRHSPIAQLHPKAFYVSEVSECVGELKGQRAFWEFTDAYFAG